MFDEIEHLADNEALRHLLDHYARLGAADREKWQDRLMEMEGVEARQLSQLHGLLIAFQWVEQNPGVPPAGKAGGVAACYRITPAGQRALRRAACDAGTGEEALAA